MTKNIPEWAIKGMKLRLNRLKFRTQALKRETEIESVEI
jgi:hypothetical protein